MIEVLLSTSRRNEFVDITEKVQKAVSKAGIKNGVCVVFVPHTTAAVTINEGADHAVAKDIRHALAALAPEDSGQYSHAEGNADAHIKASLAGSSVSVIVEKGSIVLGSWQKIFFCEFDGPRKRKFLVQCTGSK